MHKIRVNQLRRSERKNRRKQRCIWVSRVKNTQSINLVTDEMNLVLVAELQNLYERLCRIAAAYSNPISAQRQPKARGAVSQVYSPTGLCGLTRTKALIFTPLACASCRAFSYFSIQTSENASYGSVSAYTISTPP